MTGAPRGDPGIVSLILERAGPWIVVAVAAGLRLPRLDVRPLHHDEGTNVIFLLRLVREGSFHYDPTNYHGPLPYFLSALPIVLFGTTTVMLRIVPALLGTLMTVLPWLLRREIGRGGAIASGLLMAASPALVYYSRDTIHEIYLVFLTLLLVVALVRGLVSGQAAGLLVAGVAAGGVLATKETACLTFLTIGAGLLVSRGAGLPRPRRAAIAGLLFATCAVAIVLYSDLFAELGGLMRPVQALRFWGERGLHADGHGKPWWYFLGILGRDEPAILGSAVVGSAMALRRGSRFGLFLGGWAAAIVLVYSCIPYKTPWLVLNMVLPLALVSGIAFEAGLSGAPSSGGAVRPSAARRATAIVLALAVLFSARRAFFLSFVRYDDERASALVYVQTRRDALRMVARLEEYARRHPLGRDLPIEILSPDYLPLNWYLRDFTDVSYFGKVTESPGAPVVIARSDAADEVELLLGPGYARSIFPLRPGVELCLFLRESRTLPAPPEESRPGRL